METADQQSDLEHAGGSAAGHLRLRQQAARLRRLAQPLLDFWTKLNDDWVFNLSGLLAYNFLMSLFPILLVLLAIVGFILGDQAPETLAKVQVTIERMVPGGGVVFEAVATQLARSAGFLLLIGLATSLFAGSRLFVVLENCFGIIFRVRGRDFMRQNLMAFGMLALYVVLVSVIVLVSTIPSLLLPLLDLTLKSSTLSALTRAFSFVTFVVAALALLYATYSVVPNRRLRPREVWPGALTATFLFVLYELLFPTLVTVMLRPNTYGAVAAFAIVILLFFYYLAFIVLLGAELNAWIAGQREPTGDIAATMHALRTQRTKSGDKRRAA